MLDDKFNIKLVDFGLSNTYEKGGSLKTACGSPCYAAPEMIAGEAYNGKRVDIWSSGVILYAMVCGFLPFEDPDTGKLYGKILAGEFTIPKFVSQECRDLMHRVMNTDPDTRFTIEEIREHKWFKLNLPVSNEIGLIIGKNEIPIERPILEMIEEFGFKPEEATKALNANKHN